MDILQLRYFFDSANYLSISKTAEKYDVPSTSVSASIRRLEAELGCKLFDRTPNRISLNDKGLIMQESLRKIFDEMDTMLESLSATTDDNKEIKILVKAIRSIITDLVIQYKEKYTHTRFKLVADFNETSTDDYDIIVDTKNDKYPGYDSLELVKQQVLCYVPSNSNLCDRRFSLKELSQMSFVLMSSKGNHGKAFISACQKAGFTPNIVAQVNDSGCFKKIILSGIAIGVTGQLSAESDANAPLSPLNISDFRHEQTICMYYKNDVSGNAAKFVSFLKENAKK